MANLHEIARSIRAFGDTGGNTSNPLGEFAWTLRHTVQEDIAQAEEIMGSNESLGLLAHSLMYAQRMIEVGYVFTEVFVRDEYKSWRPRSDTPRVLDLGGDPGALAAMYWKYRAPNAHVTVVEANPATAHVMQQNIVRRQLEGVDVVNAAVAGNTEDTALLHLHRPGRGWHTQDYIGRKDNQSVSDSYTIQVPKIQLSSLINEGEIIDLLKVDIEGSEAEVISELAHSGKMRQVEQILMEFHHDPVNLSENSLMEMLGLLQDGGFLIREAHVTGKGLRRKSDVSLDQIEEIASLDEKIFLTFYAEKVSNSTNLLHTSQ